MIRSKLRPEEQAEVWRRYRTGESMWSISRTLGRSLKAVWRLISARGGRAPKLTHCRRLRRLVKDKLALCWSPQQIARWLPGARPRWPIGRCPSTGKATSCSGAATAASPRSSSARPVSQLVSTLDSLSDWAEMAQVPATELKKVMQAMRSGASYVPGRRNPRFNWWQEIIQQEG